MRLSFMREQSLILCQSEVRECSFHGQLIPVVLTTVLLPTCKDKMNCLDTDLQIIKPVSHTNRGSVIWKSATCTQLPSDEESQQQVIYIKTSHMVKEKGQLRSQV